MKSIKANELKTGDIFAKSLRVNGREAFLVTGTNEFTIFIESRTTKYGTSIKRDNTNLILLN